MNQRSRRLHQRATVSTQSSSVARLMLEQTSASLQGTEILTGIFSEHDLRTLRTACQCLNSLRIRVEARANTVERAIEQQLQFMQSRV